MAQLKKTSIDLLMNLATQIGSEKNVNFDFSGYFRKMDALYAREDCTVNLDTGKQKSLEEIQRSLGKPDPDKFIAPVVMPQVEAARAYLVNMFLAQDPVFQAAAPVKAIDASTKFNLLMKRDGDIEGWRTNLNMAIVSGLKYNLMAVDVDTHVRSQPSQKDASGSIPQMVTNSIHFVNMYNAFWDKTVPAREVAQNGMYAGYTKPMTRVALLKWWDELPADAKQCSQDELLASSTGVFSTQTPAIKMSTLATGEINDFQETGGITRNFTGFFEAPIGRMTAAVYKWLKKTDVVSSQFRSYNLTKMYLRIVPKEFEIRVPGDDKVQIWCLWIVGDRLVAAQRRDNEHRQFGFILAEPRADGLDYQTLSFAEDLGTIQRIVSKLWTADIKSAQRALADRALYNPLAINSKSLQTDSAAPKIPVRDSWAATGSLREAYEAIPYQDGMAGMRIAQSAQLIQMAEKMSGLNPVIQGGFVKGNKTDNQFQETIQGTEARLLLMGLTLETDFFTPIKNQLKHNTLQYSIKETLWDAQTQKALDITPEELRAGQIEFELGDGLAASAAKAMIPVMSQGYQALSQNPMAMARYDLVGMLVYMLQLSGFRRIKDFAYDDATVKANLAAMQAAAQPQPGPAADTTNAT